MPVSRKKAEFPGNREYFSERSGHNPAVYLGDID